jgi:hypothetical protein
MENVKVQANNVTTKLSVLTSKLNGSAIGWLALGVITTFIVAYALHWYITGSILEKKVYVYPDSKLPKRGDSLQVVPSTEAPFSKNGQRKTVAFWIYVHDISQATTGLRNIIRVGSETITPTTLAASPYVFMDGTDNKLYIVFNPGENIIVNGATTIEQYKDLANKYGVVLPYVPIQRWVHVAVVVNESGTSGTLTAYVDAEPVVTVNRNVTQLKLDIEGSLYIGGNDTEGFAGLISGVTIANFDMNAKDIYNIYKKGPIDNIFARMGLPAYGVRSPIYRV